MDSMRRLSVAFPRRIAYQLGDLRGDVFGGLTGGVLLLPTAMGYGILSGLGAVAGLYGAIAVCLFSAIVGGTRSLICGPNIFATLTMAVVVAEYADNLAEAMTAAMLAGLIQIAFGALRLGRYISYTSYTPYTLLSGFFTAVGILMITSQIPTAFGIPATDGGVVGNLGSCRRRRRTPIIMPLPLLPLRWRWAFSGGGG